MTSILRTDKIAIPHSPTDSDNYIECDYDTDVTPLYQAIEEKAWFAVTQFLNSGYWPESFFPDPICPQEQSRMWVTRYEPRRDGSKRVRWSQLPIHAAVIFGAPSIVLEKLIEHFPSGVRCADDHRMLPLHLAFRHGAADSCLALLLSQFPGAINCAGYEGKLPIDCATGSPNPQRTLIVQTILQQNQKTQKMQILENAIKEIKEREKIKEKELEITKLNLKGPRGRKTGTKSIQEEEEKAAVLALMKKLTALELATKDLLENQLMTKNDLKHTYMTN